MNSNSMPSVAQAVWPWRNSTAASAQRERPGRHKLRAIIQALIMAGVATLLSLVLHRAWAGLVVYLLSAVVIIAGFLFPPLFRALERAGQWLGRMAGIFMTWLLLAPFFYLCFAPARLILALLGKDPMRRRIDRQRESYLADYKPPAAAQPYTRQY